MATLVRYMLHAIALMYVSCMSYMMLVVAAPALTVVLVLAIVGRLTRHVRQPRLNGAP